MQQKMKQQKHSMNSKDGDVVKIRAVEIEKLNSEIEIQNNEESVKKMNERENEWKRLEYELQLLRSSLLNSDEYMYAFDQEGCHHVSDGARGSLTEIDRRTFVGEVYEAVKKRCPNIIHEGLFRVDIMNSQNMKKLALHELESLEAGFETAIPSNNIKITNHLNHNWDVAIAKIVSNLNN